MQLVNYWVIWNVKEKEFVLALSALCRECLEIAKSHHWRNVSKHELHCS